MSWAYWAPKSTTSTVSLSAAWASTMSADTSRANHQLGLLKFLQGPVSPHRHAGPHGPEDVGAPVAVGGRTDHDLLERAHRRAGVDTAASETGVARALGPPRPVAGRVGGGGQRRAEQHGIGAARDRLGHVAARLERT